MPKHQNTITIYNLIFDYEEFVFDEGYSNRIERLTSKYFSRDGEIYCHTMIFYTRERPFELTCYGQMYWLISFFSFEQWPTNWNFLKNPIRIRKNLTTWSAFRLIGTPQTKNNRTATTCGHIKKFKHQNVVRKMVILLWIFQLYFLDGFMSCSIYIANSVL